MHSVLHEAEDVIYGDREETYGQPDKNLNLIADLWREYLGVKCISAHDVCMMMILLKVARQRNAYKRDNLVDICGYAALSERVEEGK